jgi:hypothetical protein
VLVGFNDDVDDGNERGNVAADSSTKTTGGGVDDGNERGNVAAVPSTTTVGAGDVDGSLVV